MSCTCPYKENCKHEYATLLAIDNKQYKELDLKKEIEKTNCDLDKFIKDIPAEELKTEIAKQVEKEGISFYLNMFCLNNKFSRYLPKESREYFYNNLYNALKLDEEPFNLINDYIEIIKNVIISHDYEYIFLIFTSIVDAIVDTNTNVESNHLIFIYSKLGVFLRITYRKCSEELRNQYNEWVNKYKKNNYNNDIYLEDLLITINSESSNS